MSSPRVSFEGESRSADRILAETLRSTVEEAISSSVRNDGRVLAAALFPLFGPAIRLAVQNAFRDMLDALNVIVERNFTLTGLRWRWEAMRTGKTVAEVALLHSVVFRVERAFLFHRDTGLLMLERSHPAASKQNIDVVPGMLTAIQDFVRDSFGLPGDTGLRSIRFGEFLILVEHGTFASLAAVIRGTPPPEFPIFLAEALERLQREGGREMMAFTGETAPLERLGDQLANCLEARYAARTQKGGMALWTALGATLLVILAIVGVRLEARSRWRSYLEALGREPGIVVTSAERGWSGYHLAGLRDPLAADPTELAPRYRLDPHSIESHWREYISLDSPIVQARAREMLHAPPGLQLDLLDGALTARGIVQHAWIPQARLIAPTLAGVKRLDLTGVSDAEMMAEQKAIELESLSFPPGVSALSFASEKVMERVAEEMEKLAAFAREDGLRRQIVVFGHSDHTGLEQSNVLLARERAQFAGRALLRNGVAPEEIVASSGAEDGTRAATFRIVPAQPQ